MDGILLIVYFALIIAIIVGMVKTFSKMGYDDSWWLIIPILNFVFMCKVIGKPWWWIFLLIIPLVGSIIAIYITAKVCGTVAEAYGKGMGFAVGLFFLGFIFYPILGFGSAQPKRVA